MSDLTSDPINHPIVGVCERHEIRFDAAACDICRRDAEIERLRAALRFYADPASMPPKDAKPNCFIGWSVCGRGIIYTDNQNRVMVDTGQTARKALKGTDR